MQKTANEQEALVMKVKEYIEKVGVQLNIKTQLMTAIQQTALELVRTALKLT